MFRKLLIALGIIAAFSVHVRAQETCSSNSRMPYEWPSHRSWAVAPNIGQATIINSLTGAVTNYGSGIRAYEGMASASDENGNFLFFANGRTLYNSAGTAIYTGLMTGNEGGNTTGSAAQGIISVRHPLNPDEYYFVTTDDALTGATYGLNYAVVHKNGTMVTNSTRLGSFRTTEGIAATWHENGVDIWITVTEAGSTNIISYLLRCDGFETDPSISPAISAVGVATGASDQERGGVAFSHDSQQFAVGMGGTAGAEKVRIYDFDNATGQMTYNKGIGAIFGIYAPYDLAFSPDNSRVLASSSYGHVYSLDIATAVGTEVAGLTWSHSGIQIGADGNLYRSTMVGHGGPVNKLSGNLNNGSALTVTTMSGTLGTRGLNTMFLPPPEEPDIEEVGPYCNTDPAVDLNTTWICAGTDAENPTHNPTAYSGPGITDQANGIFDPSVAGEGTHEIIFEYCAVNDTIWIVVAPCCTAELDDVTPEICVGETYTLDGLVDDASGTGVWTIDSMPTGTSPVITTGADTIFDASNLAVAAGTYKLKFTVTDGGASCYDSVYIIVNPLPEPDLGNDTAICVGDAAVTFDPGTFTSYLWEPNSETSQTISTAVAGEYKVTVTDANSCSARDSVILTVNPLPTPDLGADQEICIGDAAVTFDAGTFTSYAWQPNSETSQTISTADAGEYIVTVTDANGCEANDTVELTVNPLPTPDLGADQEICAGDAAVTFDAGTYTSYLWSTTETTQTISTDTDGEYIVTVTDANGCEANDTVVLTVNPLPTPDLGADQEICIGDAAVTFDAGTYTSYLWSTTETTQTISTDTDGEYIVTVTDANGCDANDTVVLTVNPLPTPDLGADQEICAGDAAVTFDAGTYTSYLWSTTETTQTISTDVDGEYIVTVTDANGCEANDTVVLTVNPLPTPDLGADQEICAGDAAVTFDAGTYTSYLWSTTETTQTISTDVDGEYIVTVTDANGCEANDTVVLTVNPLPTPDLGADQEICLGDAAVTFDAGTYTSYLWSSSETTQTISTDVDGEYIVTVTDANGCEANDTVVLTVNPLPTPDLGADQEICEGDAAVTFDAGTYTSYLWSTTETTQTISTDTDGEYILTVTDANGCEANDTVVLTVNPLPTPDLGADQEICEGDAAVTFDAGTYTSYAWQPNSETSQTISTDVDGEYIVTVTDANGCEANDTVVLTVNQLPTPDLGADLAICEGDAAVTFDAGTYTSYLWSTTETTQTISTDVDGEYIVGVVDANGCIASDTVVLTVNPLPTPDLGVDSTICAGDAAVTFDAGTYTSYLWSTTETTQTISTDLDGEYIVTVTDANGCEANDTVVLTVNPLPTPDLGADQAICAGGAAVTFDAGTYTSYLWSTTETTQTISTDVAGEYIVDVVDANGCTASDTVVLTVNPLPTPDLGTDQEICAGDAAVTFDAGTFTSYLWSTTETTQTISTDVDGEYIVTVTDANGCEANDTVVLTVNPLPTPGLGVDSTICEGDAAVTFDAGTYTSYLWSTTETTQTISTDVDGEYIVTVTDANGCEANDTVVLTVNPLPTPDLGADLAICEGDAAVTFDAGTYTSYLWSTAETTQTISTDVDGEYIVGVVDANGCIASDTVVLTVNPLPTPDLGVDSTICSGDAAVTFDAGTYTSYLWSTTETTQTISTDVDGEYIVTVTDANGCEANDTVVLTVNPLPTPDLGADQEICAGDAAVMFDAGTYTSYLWSTTETTQTISTDVDGEYIVTVTDANGCEANDTVVLAVNPLPTPDLGADQEICAGDAAVTFDAGTYASYLWSGTETTQTISTDVDGEYIVTVTDANGCEANDTVVLVVNAKPVVNLGPDSTICADEPAVVFDAGTFDNYDWTVGGETTQTISTDVAGTYEVIVTTANGCSDTDEVVLTVNALPVPDLGADVEICAGGSGIIFDAGSFDAYLWSTTETTQTISSNSNGDYSVEVTDANGCKASDTVNLLVNDLPIIDLGNDITICPGSTVTLDAGPDFTNYIWQNTATTQTVDVNDVNAGEFSVMVIDTNGCSTRDTVNVIVAAELSVDLGPDTAFCDGNSITVDAGTIVGATYLWQPGNEASQTLNISTTGTYSVLVTDPMGCTGQDTIVVTVNPNPTVDLGPDVTVCPGFDSLFTVGSGWATITWNDASTAENLAVSSAGTYYVDVVDVNGCSATDTADFDFFAGATVDLGSDITICPGTTANFDAGTFASYTWHDASGAQTYTGTIAEEVSVEVVDADGCIATDTAEIFMANSLPINLGNDTAVCDGETVTLDAGYPATGYTFSWNTGETTPTIVVNASGIYGVEVQDITGCSGSDSIVVTVNPNPTVDLGPDVTVCPGFDSLFTVGTGWSSITWNDASTAEDLAVNAAGTYYVDVEDANGCTATDTADFGFFTGASVDLGDDITICPGTSADFDAGTFVSYTWHDASGAQTYTGTIAEEVTIEVVDADGCIATDTAEIFMANSLPINLGNDTAVCDGETVTLDAGYPATGYTFSWNTGETTPTIVVNASGIYGVEVQDITGCSGSDSIVVTVNPNPTVNLGPDVTVCPGFDSLFTVGTGWSSITWNDASTAEDLAVNAAGTYYVDVEDANGCTATDTADFGFFAGASVDLGDDITICAGTTANFDAGSFTSYTWHDASGAQTYAGTVAEVVTVEVIDGNGCIANDTAEIFLAASLPVDLGNDTAVCEGESVTINSGYPALGYTFVWTNGETTPEITVSTTGTYGVLVQDIAGCSGVDTMNVLINALPIVDLGPDKAVCEGFDDTFDGGAGWNSITWNTTETTPIITVSTQGEYSVSVIDANGCIDTDTAYLTVNANPIPDLGNDQTVCPGSAALFNAGTYASYAWHDGSTLDSYSNDVEEQVYVTVTDANGCVGSDTADIFVRDALLVDLGPDLDTCDGNSITVLSGYAAALNSFAWSTGETTEDITVTTSGNYSVVVTDVNGCTGTDDVDIIVHVNPTVDLGPDEAVCDGDSVIFDAGTGWSEILWGDATTNQTVIGKTAGNYVVTVKDVNGCVGTDNVDLVINSNPTVSLGSDVEVCPGNNVTFSTTPSTFASYTWHDGSTGSSFTTLNPQVVSVEVADNNGCIAVDTAALTNLPALEVNLPNDQELCDGETYEIVVPDFDPNAHTYTWSTGETSSTITVGTTATYNVFVSNGGGCAGFDTIRIEVHANPVPTVRDTAVCEDEIATMLTQEYVSYAWNTGATTQSIDVVNADVYSVTVIDSNGCTGNGSGTFTINAKPVIPAYDDQVVCEGETITLSPTLPTGTYTWKPNGENTASVLVDIAGDYEVVVTNASGCKDSIIINASYHILPQIDLGPDVIICDGETAHIGFPGGSSVIAWNIGVVADTLAVQTTGIYRATITDVNGCMGADTIGVTVSHNPTPVATEDTVVCMQEIGTLPLNVITGIRDQVVWNTGESTNDIIIDVEGTYTVTAINGDGCIGYDTVNVKRKCVSTLWVPNGFTPDGDGINDLFAPQGLNITDFDFYVFNRWGEQIFHSTSMDDKWDGTYMGREAQIDVYVWKVYYRTEEEYGGFKRQQQVGTVTLVR